MAITSPRCGNDPPRRASTSLRHLVDLRISWASISFSGFNALPLCSRGPRCPLRFSRWVHNNAVPLFTRHLNGIVQMNPRFTSVGRVYHHQEIHNARAIYKRVAHCIRRHLSLDRNVPRLSYKVESLSAHYFNCNLK